jgi:glycosyltransferase involved in cell wall biosynthesis
MRIGIDARELSGKPTGVGRYLAGLLREWTTADAAHGHELILYAHAPLEPPSARASVRLVAGSGGTVWEQRDLPRALADDAVDVLFSPAYSTPLFTSVPRVVALHDLSFVAHPEWFSWREGLRRRVLARRASAAARAVVTISEFSRGEIVTRLRTPPSRVHVIPPGVDEAPTNTPSADGADRQAHLLYVGSIFNRRHVPELIAAFTRVAARRPEAVLHLVGDNRSHPHLDIAGLIARSTASNRIQWHRYVTDDRLRQLYRQARAFAFLSEYEGLGLTPLEALAAGIPSLLLDTPVARESCGNAALYTPLASVESIATAIDRLMFDEPARRALLTAAPAVLARYDWARAARDTMRVLEEAR